MKPRNQREGLDVAVGVVEKSMTTYEVLWQYKGAIISCIVQASSPKHAVDSSRSRIGKTYIGIKLYKVREKNGKRPPVGDYVDISHIYDINTRT